METRKFNSFLQIFFSLFLSGSSTVLAGEIYEFYDGSRELAMGGARIATVNDETALLVNPAGLGKLRDYFVTLFDPELELGAKTQPMIQYDVMGTVNPQKVLEYTYDNPGQHFHSRAQLFPSYVLTNFGLGIYNRYSTDAETSTDLSNFHIDYRNDLALVLGYNFRFWDGRVKIGFNGRFVNRIEVNRDLSPVSTGNTVKSLASEGVGVASDVGMILTAPWAGLPTLAAVWRDVGSTTYNVKNGFFMDSATRPARTTQTIDVGLGMFPILGNGTRMAISAEYRDVLNTTKDTEPFRRVHAGVELNIRDALFLRAGANQKLWTAGIEFAVGNYQLQLTSYGEDIGTATTPREDRRYNVKFAFRF